MSEKNQNGEAQLKRSLTLPLIIMFGLSYLAPTVVFNYYGLFTPSTGGMYTLSICATAVVMLFTAYSYTQMVKAYPSAGSAYTYISKSVQPHVGFLSGWAMLVDYLLLPMICYLLLGVYINEYFPMIPVWAIVIVIAVIGMIINIVGIKTASIIETICTCAAIGFTILFIACIVRYVTNGGGSGTLFDPTAFYNPENFQIKGTLAASAVLCASFVGFDAVTTLAEEAKDPQKVMGKAIMGVVIGAGIIFAIVAYFSQIAWPEAYANIEDPDTGIFELFPHIGMSWLGTVFFIVDNCGSFVCALAGMGAVSRILYGMGRDNILPKKFFGKVNGRSIARIVRSSMRILHGKLLRYRTLHHQRQRKRRRCDDQASHHPGTGNAEPAGSILLHRDPCEDPGRHLARSRNNLPGCKDKRLQRAAA